MWRSLSGKPTPVDANLDEVLATTERHEIKMIPLKETNPSTPWVQVSNDVYDTMKKNTWKIALRSA